MASSTPSIALTNNPLLLLSYQTCTNDPTPEGEHVYLTTATIRVHTHIPGIPPPYTPAQQEGRALYVTGVPAKWQLKPFAQIFEVWGKVEACPTIIDLVTKNVFRFVIMGTREECVSVLEGVHGFVLQGSRVWVAEALPSSSVVELVALEGVEEEMTIEEEEEEERDTDGEKEKDRAEHVEVKVEAEAIPHRHPSPPNIAVPTIAPKERTDSTSTIKPHPAPLNLEALKNDRSSLRRISPLPAQSPFPIQETFEDIPATTTADTSTTTPLTPTATQPPLQTPTFQTQANTWATIVQKASPNNKDVDLHSDHPSRRLAAIGRIPSIVSVAHGASASKQYEAPSEQMRVILLLNLPHNITLTSISDAVREGPLVCIRFGIDSDTGSRYAGVVFQDARDADEFFGVLQHERVTNSPNRFRFIAECVRGDAFPLNDDILAMRAPTFASRRLTIVKKAFFFAFTERNLRTLCEREVGKENLQLVFVYNGGNATVIFAEVAAAVKMKRKLDGLREGAGRGGSSGIYEGLQVTFSKDPCELGEPLNLQSVMSD